MLIQILNVTRSPATTKGGKPYEVLDIAFKNLSYQGKIEGKKLMPFGDNAPAFAVLKDATGGNYEVTVVKNSAGYNDWVNAVPSDGVVPSAGPNVGYAKSQDVKNANAVRPNTFETPEERAKKQVYIVRQSSISAAVAALSVGSKSPVKAAEAIEFAKEIEAYVFGIDTTPSPSGFDDMTDDVPM